MDTRWPGAGVAASPPPRRRNPDHPPYAVMVQEALRALAENDDSTEAAISRYIISSYPGIPPGHPKLLPYYLRKLVTARELHVTPSGRYLLPDSRPRESIAPPPPVPKPNAPPCRKSSLVLRLRKTISDGDGSGRKVSWCYVGDGSTSSPSFTDQQSGSVAKRPGGELHPPVPAISGLGPPSPSLVSDPNMEGISPTSGGLDEPKDSLVIPSPINNQPSGSESRKSDGETRSEAKKSGGGSHPPVPASMQAEPEKALLSPSPASNPSIEVISPTLGLDEPKEALTVPSPINVGSESWKQDGELGSDANESRKQDGQLGSDANESRKQDGELGSDAKIAVGESHPSVSTSKQAEPEKALLSSSPPPILDPDMVGLCPTLGLVEPKESPTVQSSFDEQQLGSEDTGSHSPSMQLEPEEALLPPSSPPLLDSNLECTSLDKLNESSPAPIPDQQSGSESRKQDGPLTSVSMQAEPEKEPLQPPPVLDHNMEWTSPALRLDELKESSPVSPCITDQQSVSEPVKLDGESLSSVSIQVQLEKERLSPPPSSVPDPNMECISPTSGLDEPKESLVVPSLITGQQVGSENGKSFAVPSSITGQQMGSVNGESLVVPSPVTEQQVWSENGESFVVPSSITGQQVGSENEESLVVPSPITEQQVGSENGESLVLSPITKQQLGSENGESLVVLSSITGQQAGSENGESLVLFPITEQQVGSENGESLVVPSCITRQQVGSENGEALVVPSPITEQQVESENGESQILSPITEQQLGSEDGESMVVPFSITEQQVESENGESQVLSPITEQQLGSENGESHPPVPASMQIEPEEVLLPPLPPSELNLEFTSPVLGLDKPKESLPILAPIAEQQSENELRKRDGEAHLPVTSSIHTKLENPSLLPPVSYPNMEWASQAFGLNELKESSLVSCLITNQQSVGDPDSMQADSEKVLSLLLPPSPPVSGQLQTEPDPHLPKKTSSPPLLNSEPNRVWSSPALMLDELKESLPISTAIANQQSGTESSKKNVDSHPPNSALMQQTDPGKEPPPPLISVQLQVEPEPKLSSADRVLEKPSLASGEKKSLSRKQRLKHRRLWFAGLTIPMRESA